MKFNVSRTMKSAKNIITANSPVLLVGTAVVGIITTGVLAAKGGYDARGIVDEKEAELGRETTFAEKAQLTWLCYAVPGVTGASTIAAVVGLHTIHNKKNAYLAGLLALTTNKFDDYQEKAEELLGTKKSQQLRDDVAQKSLDRDPPQSHDIALTGSGVKQLVKDDYTGRFFDADMAIVERAINEVNRLLVDNGECSLNDFYDSVGLDPTPFGADTGWRRMQGDNLVMLKWGAAIAPDGSSCLNYWFLPSPQQDFDK